MHDSNDKGGCDFSAAINYEALNDAVTEFVIPGAATSSSLGKRALV